MSQRSLRDAVVTISDGSSASVIVKIGEGNISWTERQNIEYLRDRGQIDTVRLGDDEPVDVSFDFQWEWLKSDSLSTDTDTLRDVIRGESPWTTTGDACEPYAVDISIVLSDCSITETVTLAYFRYEELSYDLRAGQISCTGKCNIDSATIS